MSLEQSSVLVDRALVTLCQELPESLGLYNTGKDQLSLGALRAVPLLESLAFDSKKHLILRDWMRAYEPKEDQPLSSEISMDTLRQMLRDEKRKSASHVRGMHDDLLSSASASASASASSKGGGASSSSAAMAAHAQRKQARRDRREAKRQSNNSSHNSHSSSSGKAKAKATNKKSSKKARKDAAGATASSSSSKAAAKRPRKRQDTDDESEYGSSDSSSASATSSSSSSQGGDSEREEKRSAGGRSSNSNAAVKSSGGGGKAKAKSGSNLPPVEVVLSSDEDDEPNDLFDTEDPDVYEVESILDKRKGARFGEPDLYLIKWVGYAEPTWEPAANVSKDLIEEFEGQPVRENEYVVEDIRDRKSSRDKDTKLKAFKYLIKWVGYDDLTWEPADNLPHNLRRKFDQKFEARKRRKTK
ncbi:hypothetical protein PybrP1_008680 [[Pythium] brassicae (nom. inval.)]|nr:hypothetical protein PybrP1_008680 [[Pythium] brassicae (nom. inval.)]